MSTAKPNQVRPSSAKFVSDEATADLCRQNGSTVTKALFKPPRINSEIAVYLHFYASQCDLLGQFLKQLGEIPRNMGTAICDDLAEDELPGGICKAIDFIGKQLELNNSSLDMGQFSVYYRATCMLSDRSEKCAEAFGVHNAIQLLLKVISDGRLRAEMVANQVSRTVLMLSISSLHNMAKLAELKQIFCELKAVDVLSYFLDVPEMKYSGDEKIQISAISTIACFLPDDAAYAFSDKFGIIPKITKVLKKALASTSQHQYLGFTAEELAECLGQLAVNDANKAEIAKSGAIDLLGAMLHSENDLEKKRAVDCLWTLAFSDSIRKQIAENGKILADLQAIAESDKSDLELKLKAAKTDEYIRFKEDFRKASKRLEVSKQSELKSSLPSTPGAPDKARLTLKGASLAPTPIPGAVVATPPTAPATSAPSASTMGDVPGPTQQASSKIDSSKGHVFVSYSWKYQATCLRIRDALKAAGYNVWMDVDNMHGSTLQAMAEAVEFAEVILVCYGDAYKRSNNCHAEAEYMFTRSKKFVPILMQNGYQADGWLGMIIGAKLYFDMSLEKYSFEDQILKVLKEVEMQLHPELAQSQSPKDDSNKQQQQQPQNSGGQTAVCTRCQQREAMLADSLLKQQTPVIKNSKIAAWSSDDVSEWLKRESLELSLSGCDGKVLLGLSSLKDSAPEVHYRLLLDLCRNSFPDSVKFMVALETLLAST